MDRSYDPDAFYTDSTDKRGHSKTIRYSIAPDLHYQIGVMIASGKIPEFKTSGDYTRNALHHAAVKYEAVLADPEWERGWDIHRHLALAHSLEARDEAEQEAFTLWNGIVVSGSPFNMDDLLRVKESISNPRLRNQFELLVARSL